MNYQSKVFSINQNFSTTNMISKEKPILENYINDKFKSIIFLPRNVERIKEGGLRTKGYFKQNLLAQPLVTIITVVFNGEKFIRESIDSVLNQTYANIEYIVIDGGSTDSTIKIIEQYNDLIDYWVSEKDKGIYNAMNKGIKLSTGQIIGILNSDDYYNSASVHKIVDIYKQNQNKYNDLIVLTGSILKIDEQKSIQFINRRNYYYLSKNIDWGMPLNHPSTFISKKLYKKVGIFSERFSICGDYDLIYRIYHSIYKPKFIFLNDVIATMRLDGVSNQTSSIFTRSIEHFLIRKINKNNLINICILLVWTTKTIIKHCLRRILSTKVLKKYYARYQ
ncbi:MAG: glycosyltransferase family 2 protein [Candidatus Woesearchaeota archaeon]